MTNRKTKLHYWHVEICQDDDGSEFFIGYGIVTGHRKLEDATRCHTSVIQSIEQEGDEVILKTRKSKFHCPLNYCSFDRQDLYPEVIPNYKELKRKYSGCRPCPSVEPENVLLVIADFSHYYFHSLYYVPESSVEGSPLGYTAYPHLGMFQDSFLVHTINGEIDLRYFPNDHRISFYHKDTGGRPLYIENLGETAIFVEIDGVDVLLNPCERKEIVERNVE